MSTDHRRPRRPASCGPGLPEDFLSILLLRFELACDFPPWIVLPRRVVYALFRAPPVVLPKELMSEVEVCVVTRLARRNSHLHVVRHRGRLRNGLPRLAQTLDVTASRISFKASS